MVVNTDLVRQPQHQGVFYPADPLLLQQQLSDCLRGGGDSAVEGTVKAIVVPHAGYDYSARVAAQAYAALKGQGWIQRIVILAPNHQTSVEGGLICSHDAWATPLGAVDIDHGFIDQYWESLSYVAVDDEVHQAEYSIEVQLPFIQQVLADIPIAPILVGECDEAQIADILRPAWECDNTLIIISSDLYHYLPRELALPLGMTIARITEQKAIEGIRPEIACGHVALRGLMKFATATNYYWRTLDVRHSGQDNRFSAQSLVGYGAFILCIPPVYRLPD